ncbi:MAG: hypothetical protein Q8903_15215, partial [Bacteroidota bacterium]|nr:hypothetical protein [Bacteroidota bacterium]
HFADIRNTIQGIKEAYDVFKETLAEPLIKGAELEVLRQNFKGTTEDMELFKKAVAGTVGEAGLIKLSNQATDLGLSLNQQAILFSLAEDSADKYGTTVEEGFQKAVMASEGNVKGLKALGIQRKVYEDILKSLAESQGKELKDMDAEEVKQLRLQALIKASGVTLEDVAKKQADSKDKLEQMGVAFEEVVATGGQAIATVFIPMLKHISDLVNKLNETAPALTGLAAGVVMVGGAYSTLNMTGILPFIINTKTLSYEMQFAKLTFIETAEAEGVLAASTAAASTAAKGFFTSIGPIGWAIIGFTALAEAINLFSQKTEDAKQGLSAEEKELIKAQIEFNNLANAVNNTKNSEQGRKDALDKLNKTYPEYLGKQINDINNQQVLNNAVANGNKLLREKITLLANNRVLQEKQNKAVDDRAKVVNLEQDLEDYKKLHPDENEIIEEDRGSIDNPGYTVKVVRAKDIMDKMRTKINEANKIAEQSNNEYLDTQNRLGVNKPSDKVELTRGDEKKKLNAELDDLNKQLDGTKATDTKAQNTLLSKIRAVKSKLKKYKDEESEDSGKSSKSDKLTEGYELDVVKSEYPNQKLKDNDAVKKKYEKIIEDSTSSISQFKTISDVVLSHLKTVEEKKKYLEEVEKKAEEKMNAANDKDHPNAT